MIANREVIERSLSDMKFYHRLNNMDELVVGEPSDRQKEHEMLGSHAMSLWTDTLAFCMVQDTSVVPAHRVYDYMLTQLEFDEFMDLINKYMDAALDYGIDCKLEALYAGVPYDDIVA